MKKIILSMAMVALTTSAVSASEYFDKAQKLGVGVTSSSVVDSDADAEYGAAISGVFLKQMHFKEDCHLSLGVVVNVDINKPADDVNTLIDVLPTVSLNIPNTKVNVAALGGYTYGMNGDVTSTGMTYGGSIGYDVNEGVEVTARFLRSNLTATLDGIPDFDYDNDRITVGVNYSF
jgi:opacity protein-like surface antigen